ncbi:MAG: NAD-dependent deacylase [Bacteroidales bacterium]|nr:NAD-dependent deacylase [Bacteroidales bacterium]
MKRIVILSGAGISKESGISTFRDHDGLWNKYRFEDLATPQAWARNPQLVLDWYNMRRKQLFEVHPNEAHQSLVRLEKEYDVQIITQNVDDLHERAGSSHVTHLHGELKKARSTANENLIYTLKDWELNLGDTCELGSQLRPHIVWFGESVPMIEAAIELTTTADIFLIIGTSLLIYPAASLVNYVKPGTPIFLLDPEASSISADNLTIVRQKASLAVPTIVDRLLEQV